MGKILDRVRSIFRRRSTEKIIPKESGITRPDSVEYTARITGQTGIFQAETGAPLQPEHRERFEKIFGPAVIRNGYKHPIVLQNDLLNLELQPGESRVIKEINRAGFSNKGHGPHNMIQEWDPYNTLRDVVAEYERSQDPVGRYNMSTESLCATSKINVWRQRGQGTVPGAPHRPSTDLRWKDQDETPTKALTMAEVADQFPNIPAETFPGFGGGKFGGGGAGGEWTLDAQPQIPPETVQFINDVQSSAERISSDFPSSNEAAKPEESYSQPSDNSVQADTPAPDPAPDPPSGDQNA